MTTERRWNEEVARALVEVAGDLPDTRMGKMFGYPAVYAGGKLCACAYGDGVGLKLPAQVVAVLVDDEGFEPFRPYGRGGMREWVFLKATDGGAVHARADLFEQAAAFVSPGPGRA
jgi:hypothetical protein